MRFKKDSRNTAKGWIQVCAAGEEDYGFEVGVGGERGSSSESQQRKELEE